MSRDLEPIELIACEVKDLAKLRRKLNAFAAEGYAPLVGTYVPTPDGGVLVYVLGDVNQVGEAAEVEATEVDATEDEGASVETIEAKEPIVTVTTIPPANGNGNGNGAHTPDTHSALQE